MGAKRRASLQVARTVDSALAGHAGSLAAAEVFFTEILRILDGEVRHVGCFLCSCASKLCVVVCAMVAQYSKLCVAYGPRAGRLLTALFARLDATQPSRLSEADRRYLCSLEAVEDPVFFACMVNARQPSRSEAEAAASDRAGREAGSPRARNRRAARARLPTARSARSEPQLELNDETVDTLLRLGVRWRREASPSVRWALRLLARLGPWGAGVLSSSQIALLEAPLLDGNCEMFRRLRDAVAERSPAFAADPLRAEAAPLAWVSVRFALSTELEALAERALLDAREAAAQLLALLSQRDALRAELRLSATGL